MPANTKDRFPQFFRSYVTESAANTYTQKELDTPVPIHLPNGKFLVMNILRVYVSLQMGAGDSGDALGFHIADRSRTDIADWDSGGIVASISHEAQGAVAAGLIQLTRPQVVNLDDGNGYGYLYVRSKMYLGIKGVSQASALTAKVAILYTLVEIAAEEFIGLAEGP